MTAFGRGLGRHQCHYNLRVSIGLAQPDHQRNTGFSARRLAPASARDRTHGRSVFASARARCGLECVSKMKLRSTVVRHTARSPSSHLFIKLRPKRPKPVLFGHSDRGCESGWPPERLRPSAIVSCAWERGRYGCGCYHCPSYRCNSSA